MVDVRRSGDEVLHQLDGPVPAAGTRVRGLLDRERRYALMRAHTALHVRCGVIWRDYGASVTGGSMEPGSARMDFELERMSADFAAEVEVACARLPPLYSLQWRITRVTVVSSHACARAPQVFFRFIRLFRTARVHHRNIARIASSMPPGRCALRLGRVIVRSDRPRGIGRPLRRAGRVLPWQGAHARRGFPFAGRWLCIPLSCLLRLVAGTLAVGESEQERRRAALARKPMPRDTGDAPARARARARSAGAIAGRGRM